MTAVEHRCVTSALPHSTLLSPFLIFDHCTLRLRIVGI